MSTRIPSKVYQRNSDKTSQKSKAWHQRRVIGNINLTWNHVIVYGMFILITIIAIISTFKG